MLTNTHTDTHTQLQPLIPFTPLLIRCNTHHPCPQNLRLSRFQLSFVEAYKKQGRRRFLGVRVPAALARLALVHIRDP